MSQAVGTRLFRKAGGMRIPVIVIGHSSRK